MGMSDTIDSLAGVAGLAVTAGVVMKITDSVFKNAPSPSKRSSKRSSKGKRSPSKHPGNFSNVGF